METHHLWIIFGILLIIIEIFTPGFVLASFGIGAFASGLAAYFDYGTTIQLIAFSIVTIIIFFGIRPMFIQYFHKAENEHKTGISAYIGKEFQVTEEINNSTNAGRVQIGSESQRAKSIDGATIKESEIITIEKIEGSTLFVSQTKNKEN